MAILDFAVDYVLENEFLKLSPLGMQHLEGLSVLTEEEKIWEYFLAEDSARGKIKTYIQIAIENRQKSNQYTFVIYDKTKNRYAGSTRFYNYHAGLNILKLGHTCYGTDFWGTGLNKHCKFLLFEFAFEQLEVARIGFGVHAQNTRSTLALQSIGCTREGVLKDFLFDRNGTNRTDLYLYGLLKSEWISEVKHKLSLKCKPLYQ